MAKILDESQEKSVVEMYRGGMAIKDIAVKFDIGYNAVFPILHKAGVSTKRRYEIDIRVPDKNKVLELYNQGIRVAGIAKRLGYSRTNMIRYFRINHIPMRNAREQQIERMKFSTPEQKAHLTEAAHKAARGRVKSEKEKIQAAKTKFKNAKINSVYEKSLSDYLMIHKINFSYQFPVGIYNVDFLINGVAVEIFGGGWHLYGEHKARFPERTKFILDKGYPILFVFSENEKSFYKMIDDVILPNIFEMSSDKSFVGKYRVLWNKGRFITNGDKTTIYNALECPTTNRVNPVTGRFESVLKEFE